MGDDAVGLTCTFRGNGGPQMLRTHPNDPFSHDQGLDQHHRGWAWLLIAVAFGLLTGSTVMSLASMG
jgi:hypothetical protein